MTAPDDLQAALQSLWDDLADHDAPRTDDAMLLALTRLSTLIGAQTAFWLGSVRVGPEGDPLRGWRPAAIRYLHQHERYEAIYREHCRRIEGGQIDPSIIENVRRAGEFRVNVKHEMVPPAWYASEFHQTFFAPLGIQDTVYVVMPVGPDVESWFGFQRIGQPEPHFGARDRAVLETAVRPLRWLHRRIALLYGLQLAETPLTATERRVLGALLGGGTEREIADALALSPSTVHTYCARICRKLNVRGRTGLMALWLGRGGG